jgi:hypothetical protein
LDEEELMATDIQTRLARLRARRTGTGNLSLEALTESAVIAKSLNTIDGAKVEDWELRGKSDQFWTRYALGAMEAVDDTYTRISKETGERVANQLRERLGRRGVSAEFKLQGSVPLDVHIRRVSDVDVLALTKDFKTYDRGGAMAKRGAYRNPTDRTSREVLAELRSQVEADLEDAYPKADVDTTGAKAVKVSGGSLARSVDVVPAHWYDTEAYQASERQADRVVRIYDKKNAKTIDNLPFLHIELIGRRCDGIKGGLRKAIRLCKTVKADSDRDIKLSSFDIAAIMYHADMDALRMGQYSDLAVLAETQRHLDALYQDSNAADKLWVPDGSRRIFDSEEKRTWLLRLSMEMDELLQSVYQENFPGQGASSTARGTQRELVGLLKV